MKTGPSATVSISVHTKRVRLNPDGSRTTIEESDSGRTVTTESLATSRAVTSFVRRLTLTLAAIGAAQLVYGTWEGWSDAKAATVFRGSPSCGIARLLASNPVQTGSGECRLEEVTVVRRDWHSGRGGRRSYLSTVAPDGRRDNPQLISAEAIRLWSRVSPGQRITVQRFVAPGYHLTNGITALADAHGVAMSDLHPNAGAHHAAVNVALGAGLLFLGLVTYARRRQTGAPE